MSETFTVGEIKGVVVRDLRKYVDSRNWLADNNVSTLVVGEDNPNFQP